LKRDKPYALDSIGNDKKIFQTPERCDVNASIKKCDTDQSFIEIKGPNKDLGLSCWQMLIMGITTCLLSHRGNQVPVHTAQRRHGTLGIFSTKQFEFVVSFTPKFYVRHDFNDLKNVSLRDGFYK